MWYTSGSCHGLPVTAVVMVMMPLKRTLWYTAEDSYEQRVIIKVCSHNKKMQQVWRDAITESYIAARNYLKTRNHRLSLRKLNHKRLCKFGAVSFELPTSHYLCYLSFLITSASIYAYICLQHKLFFWGSGWNQGTLESAMAARLFLMYSFHTLEKPLKVPNNLYPPHKLNYLMIKKPQALDFIFPDYREAARTHNALWQNTCIILCIPCNKHYIKIILEFHEVPAFLSNWY